MYLIICKYHTLHSCNGNDNPVTEDDSTASSGTHSQKNMTTTRKANTSNLIMIMAWVTNTSFQLPEREWDTLTHT